MFKIVLMIDDDQDDREIFREALLTCNPNLQILFAADGVEALDFLQSHAARPDVIFLDYNMPRMNGVECLKELKSRVDTKTIPVVMYTTSGDREEEKVIRFLGADYYMRKTVSFAQLCTELDRLLKEISKTIKSVNIHGKSSSRNEPYDDTLNTSIRG